MSKDKAESGGVKVIEPEMITSREAAQALQGLKAMDAVIAVAPDFRLRVGEGDHVAGVETIGGTAPGQVCNRGQMLAGISEI